MLRVHIIGNTFHAVTLNTRLARAQMAIAHAAVLDTRAISMDWHFRALLTTGDRSEFNDEASGKGSLGGGGGGGGGSASGRRPQQQDLFLNLNFVEQKQDIKVVDATLRNMLATIAIDAVRDIGEVGLTIAYGVLTIIKSAEFHMAGARYREKMVVRSRSATGASGGSDGSSGSDHRNGKERARTDDGGYATDKSDDTNTYAGSNDPSKDRARARVSTGRTVRPTGIHAHVTMVSPCFILLEDPSIEESAAYLVTFSLETQMGIDYWGGPLATTGESQEALHASLRSIDMYVLSDTGKWLAETGPSPSHGAATATATAGVHGAYARVDHFSRASVGVMRRVCDPFSVDVHLTRRVERNIVLAANVAVNVGDIDLTLSLANIALARAIALRGTLTGLLPPKVEDLTFYCIFGDRGGDGGTQVDIYIIALNVGKITVTAVSDIHEHLPTGPSRRRPPADGLKSLDDDPPPVPVLRMQLLSLTFNADGALHPKVYVNSRSFTATVDVLNLEGTGQAALAADFFNPVVAVWEPVVEELKLGLSVEKEGQGISSAIDALSSLQINVSGRLLDVMMGSYAKWRRSESDKKAYLGLGMGMRGLRKAPLRPRRHRTSSGGSADASYGRSREVSSAPLGTAAAAAGGSVVAGHHADVALYATSAAARADLRTQKMQRDLYLAKRRVGDGQGVPNLPARGRLAPSRAMYSALSAPSPAVEPGPDADSCVILHNRLLCDVTYRLVPATASYSQFSDMLYRSLGVNAGIGAPGAAAAGSLTPYYLTASAGTSTRR